ncbi:MAG: DUF350 domain-containing protein [Myxococcales bacterium]|nr:DUF350 domain-containing protein [Myxococcales bacterium]
MTLADLQLLLQPAAYFAGSVAVVVAGKLVRDALALWNDHRLPEQIVHQNNVAAAVEMGAFVLALVIGLLGSIAVHAESALDQALDFGVTGLLVIVMLTVNDRVTIRLALRSVNLDDQVNKRRNLAVAIVRGSGNVAAALVIRAALGHDSLLHERALWALIGQVALVVLALAYQRLTPYDDAKEIAEGNVAAALPLAGMLLAVGIVTEAALRGDGVGWAEDLTSVGIDLAASFALLTVLRWLADAFLLPGTTFAEEIARDKNAGAGFIEGASFVAGGWAVAFFLN